MGGPNDNIPAIRPSKVQGVLKTVQAVHNRKPLSRIDKNIIGVPPHPSAPHKRGVLAEKNAACNKNVGVPTRRPITRKFSAQLAGKDHLQPLEKVRSSAQSIISTTPSSDCTIIDAEDYKPTDGQDVPMFVQHTEAMLEEIDHMDAEVEMEDLESDELVMDIDSPDRTNPLAVTEYIDDIYAFYKKTESLSCVPPNYMEQQFDINERMRAILVDWLVEVHYKFELMDETLYLTVNLIDRFLAVHSVVRKKLQLVGITAMLLACKYEEVSVPIVDDFIAITDKAYCREEVLHMEKLMVNTLQFNLSVPTPYVFMRRFLKAAQCDNMMEKLSFFIIELSLIEYETLRFPPSLVAAAAIFTANCSLSGTKQWSKTCETCSSYSVDQLLECARMMVAFHEKAGDGKLTGVYKKYSTSKYGYAANTVPAVFHVDG